MLPHTMGQGADGEQQVDDEPELELPVLDLAFRPAMNLVVLRGHLLWSPPQQGRDSVDEEG
nr:hypothetical protein [Rhodoferax sp.]